MAFKSWTRGGFAELMVCIPFIMQLISILGVNFRPNREIVIFLDLQEKIRNFWRFVVVHI
mgnify:CR=1 FL=1